MTGKSIGKLVFVSKLSLRGIQQDAKTTGKLKDLEQAFYKAYCEEMNSGAVASHFAYVPLPPPSMYIQLAPPALLPQPSIVWDQTKTLHQTYLNALQQMKQPSAPTAAVSRIAATPSQAIHAPPPAGASRPLAAHQHVAAPTGRAMRHPIAPNQASHQAVPAPAIAPTPSYQPAESEHVVYRPPVIEASSPANLSNHVGCHPSAIVSLPHPTQAPTAMQGGQKVDSLGAAGRGQRAPATQTTSQHTATAGSFATGPPAAAPHAIQPNPSVEVPDFLSGFERVWQKKPVESDSPPLLPLGVSASFGGGYNANDVLLQTSPPLTSKSFDDLHRLLGTDLSQQAFDLNGTHRDQGVHNDVPQQGVRVNTPGGCGHNLNDKLESSGHVPRATHNDPADAYAAFAQQSVQAVMQHSAYSTAQGGVHRTTALSQVQGGEGSLFVVDYSLGLAGMYGTRQVEPVSRAANVQVQARQQIPLQSRLPPTTSNTTSRGNLISGSERSSDVGTEDGDSMHGSTFNCSSSDNTSSNDSDSEGPPRKKSKRGEEEGTVSHMSTHMSKTQ